MATPEAVKAQLKKALPPSEWAAVEAWLSTFYPYQLRWVLDWGRFSLVLKSRQVGASHTIAAWAVLCALLGETTTIISVGEREALEVLDKCELHAMALERLGSKWAASRKRGPQLKLASGGRIIALPQTSGGRSYSGNVVLDEFAYVDHPEKLWDGAAGTVLHGYKLRVISTPNGVGNSFHKLWTDPKAHAGYTLHATTIDQAIEDGLPVDLDECWKMARGDPRVFDQLFRCSFLDNDAQYIPSALIDEASVDDTYCHDGEVFAGLDVGRTNDLTVLVVLRRDSEGVLWLQHIEERKRTSSEDLDELARMAVQDFGATRLCVDSSGLGQFPAENMQRKFGRFRVEPVPFTLQSKEDMATSLYTSFARRALRIPRANSRLRDDIASIRRIITSAGNVRYDAPHTSEGHADRAWALALAIHGTTKTSSKRVEIYDHATNEEYDNE